MRKIEEINNLIQKEKNLKTISTKEISDGRHTFGDLYKHRIILFCSLCNIFSDISWKSRKHFDEESDPMFNDSFIAGINTPNGVITYHIKLEYWDLFHIPEIERAPKYDYYNDEDIFERVLLLSTNINCQNKFKK